MDNINQHTRIGTFCDKCRQVICLCESEIKAEKEQKPIKAKPHFYSVCLKGLQEIAKEHGYNLVIHGSMNRDMDLIAIPWIDNPSEHLKMLNDFCEYLGVPKVYKPQSKEEYMFTILPGGRHSYVINLCRGSKFNSYVDEQYYLDISITPKI